jgi:hypothetical protein
MICIPDKKVVGDIGSRQLPNDDDWPRRKGQGASCTHQRASSGLSKHIRNDQQLPGLLQSSPPHRDR